MDRRSFIQKTTLGTVAGVMAFPFISAGQNKKLKIGLIGAGWYGMVITKAALESGSVEVIAVCDVDSEHLQASIVEIEKLQEANLSGIKIIRNCLILKDSRR